MDYSGKLLGLVGHVWKLWCKIYNAHALFQFSGCANVLKLNRDSNRDFGFDVCCEESNKGYVILEPFAISRSVVSSASLSPCSAAKSIPCETSPANFVGFRLYRKTTRFP